MLTTYKNASETFVVEIQDEVGAVINPLSFTNVEVYLYFTSTKELINKYSILNQSGYESIEVDVEERMLLRLNVSDTKGKREEAITMEIKTYTGDLNFDDDFRVDVYSGTLTQLLYAKSKT